MAYESADLRVGSPSSAPATRQRSRRWLCLYLHLSLGLSPLMLHGCSKPPHGEPTGAAGDGSRAAPAAAQKRRPGVDLVMLLTIDALRADQPWVGYKGVDTPYLSKLASQSVVYTRAYSLATITTTSLSAMLSSRYASELRREACIFGLYDLDQALASYLQSKAVVTLAAHGHSIFAGRIAPSLGFDQWKLVKGLPGGRLQGEGAVVGGEIADLLLGYLDEQPPDARKQLLWAHFPDPHDAYVAHKEFPTRSQVPARKNYDSEVAYTDAAIGRVLQAIEQKGLQDRTAIIVTADHGEAFGEHGTIRHGFAMFEEEIRVPLIVHVPGIEPRVVDVPRSTIDVAPTVVDLLGYASRPEWRGTSLLRDFQGKAPPESRPVVVDLPEMKGREHIQAVIRDNLKVILTAGGEKVFDVADDPRELAPIANSSAEGRMAIEAAEGVASRLEPIDPVPCGMLSDVSARLTVRTLEDYEPPSEAPPIPVGGRTSPQRRGPTVVESASRRNGFVLTVRPVEK